VASARAPRAFAVLLLAGLVTLLVAGCGGGTQVDYTKAAETVRASLESKREGFGVKVESVDCPSGVDVEPGTHFECTVRFPGEKVRYARLRIRDADADLSLESLSPRPFAP
jgi:hypothetical protein